MIQGNKLFLFPFANSRRFSIFPFHPASAFPVRRSAVQTEHLRVLWHLSEVPDRSLRSMHTGHSVSAAGTAAAPAALLFPHLTNGTFQEKKNDG